MGTTLTPSEKIIQKVIYERPEVVAKILKDSGYKLSAPVTLQSITATTFKAIYLDGNKEFAKRMDSFIQTGEYSNFVMVAVAVVGAIVSGILGSNQAKKQRELQRAIAIANLENDKLLAQEQLRVYGEVERTKILADSLLQYRQSLQSESTSRQKNVYIYLVAIAFGIAIIYGTNLLLKEN